MLYIFTSCNIIHISLAIMKLRKSTFMMESKTKNTYE